MQTVRSADGTRYLLVKRSGEAALVRNPATGTEQYLPLSDLEATGTSALETAAGAVTTSVRRVLTAVHSDRALGLLLEIDRRGPVAVRDLLEAYDCCESDLHGLLGEFLAAELIEETTVAGERAYDTTETATEALTALQG